MGQLATATAGAAPATAALLPGAQEAASRRLDALMRDLLIVDTHVDTPALVRDENYDVGVEHRYYDADIPRWRRGRAGAVFFGLMALPERHQPHLWVQRTLDLIDTVHEMARRYPRDLEVALTAADILRVHGQGKIAAVLSIEGGHQIQDDLGVLRDYYRLGARYLTLTHFKTNNWADASTDAAVHNGLAPLGRQVVQEMNRLGMMVDVSHVSDKAFFDVLEASRAPVIASHSSARALCGTERNMSDEMIRALARRGGAVFVNFAIIYLDQKAWEIFRGYRDQRDRELADVTALEADPAQAAGLRRAIRERYRRRLPVVDYHAVLRHIDHIVKLVGADHVGLGSDFDGMSGMVPRGLEDVSKYPVLVRGMIELGYSDDDIRKIMGGNLIRVMRKIEEVGGETHR